MSSNSDFATAMARMTDAETLAIAQRDLNVSKAIDMVNEVRAQIQRLYIDESEKLHRWGVGVRSDNEALQIYHQGYNVAVEWKQQYENSIDGALLGLVLFKKVPGGKRLGEGYFKPAVNVSNGVAEYGWAKEKGSSVFMTSREVAGFALALMVNAITDAK